GFFRVPALDVIGVVRHPLEIEHVAKLSLGPWELRPVAIEALRFKNVAHLARELLPFHAALRRGAARHGEKKEKRTWEEELHRDPGIKVWIRRFLEWFRRGGNRGPQGKPEAIRAAKRAGGKVEMHFPGPVGQHLAFLTGMAFAQPLRTALA